MAEKSSVIKEWSPTAIAGLIATVLVAQFLGLTPDERAKQPDPDTVPAWNVPLTRLDAKLDMLLASTRDFNNTVAEMRGELSKDRERFSIFKDAVLATLSAVGERLTKLEARP